MRILNQIPTESKIRTHLRQICFAKTFSCPRCGGRHIKKYEQRYHCKKCRRFFSLTSCNWLKGLKLPLRTFWFLLWCWTQKVPLDQTSNLTGLSLKTVEKWFAKFRSKIPEDFEVRLSENVQMDEMYRGGKKNGYSIIGAKQKGTRKIVCKVIQRPSVQRHNIVEFLSQFVEPGTTLCTDGGSIYKKISNWWPVDHRFEIHKKFEFALTSEIEGLWGNFVTFIRRMYHHITKGKVVEYVREFVARFSHVNLFSSPLNFLQITLLPVSF